MRRRLYPGVYEKSIQIKCSEVPGGAIALSAHVVVRGLESWPETLARLKALAAHRFGIEHVTLQPEIDRQTPTAAVAPRVVTLYAEHLPARRPASARDGKRIFSSTRWLLKRF